MFITIVVGCSAKNVESRVKRGLHHWGHADVNIPDSWVKMFFSNVRLLHFYVTAFGGQCRSFRRLPDLPQYHDSRRVQSLL